MCCSQGDQNIGRQVGNLIGAQTADLQSGQGLCLQGAQRCNHICLKTIELQGAEFGDVLRIEVRQVFRSEFAQLLSGQPRHLGTAQKSNLAVSQHAI